MRVGVGAGVIVQDVVLFGETVNEFVSLVVGIIDVEMLLEAIPCESEIELDPCIENDADCEREALAALAVADVSLVGVPKESLSVVSEVGDFAVKVNDRLCSLVAVVVVVAEGSVCETTLDLLDNFVTESGEYDALEVCDGRVVDSASEIDLGRVLLSDDDFE